MKGCANYWKCLVCTIINISCYIIIKNSYFLRALWVFWTSGCGVSKVCKGCVKVRQACICLRFILSLPVILTLVILHTNHMTSPWQDAIPVNHPGQCHRSNSRQKHKRLSYTVHARTGCLSFLVNIVWINYVSIKKNITYLFIIINQDVIGAQFENHQASE